MSPCDTVHDHLAEHARRDLDPALRAAIDGHAATCTECAELLAAAAAVAPAIEAVLAGNRVLPTTAAPVGITPPMVATPTPPPAPTPRAPAIGLTRRPALPWACAMVCAVLAVAGWARPTDRVRGPRPARIVAGDVRAEAPARTAPTPDAATPPTLEPAPPSPAVDGEPAMPALALVSMAQADLALRAGEPVPVRFTWSAPVDPDALLRRLKASGPDGKPITVRPDSNRPGKTVTLRFEAEAGDVVSVSIARGLASEDGNVLAHAASDEITLTRELALVDHDVSWVAGTPNISLCFNAPIDARSARSRITCTPPVAFEVECSSTTVRLTGDFSPRQRYRIAVSAGLATRDGDRLLRDAARSVWIGERPTELQFAFAGQYLSSAGTGQVHVATRGLTRFAVESWRLYPENLTALGNDPDRLRRLGRKVDRRELAVEPRADRSTVTALSLEDVAGGARGVLLLTLEPLRKEDGSPARDDYPWDQRRSVVVVASDLGVSCRLAERELVCWTTSILSSRAIEGASVRCLSRKNRVLGSATSGADGVATLALAPADEGDGPSLVVVSQGDDQTFLKLDRGMLVRPSDGRPHCPDRGCEAFLTTVRGMHRPGETVVVDAIVRDRAGTCAAPFPVELALSSPDGRVRVVRSAVLDAQGGATFAIALDATWPSGGWRAALRLPDGGAALGEVGFSVASFVPEALAVTLGAPAERPAASAPVEVAVAANHLYGAPAAGLRVQGTARWVRRALGGPARDLAFGRPDIAATIAVAALDDQTTGADGHATVVVPPTDAQAECPLALELDVAVLAPDGRPTRRRTRVALDAYPSYAGGRVIPGATLTAGEGVPLELALVDGAGEPIAGEHAVAIAWSRVYHECSMERSGRGYEYRFHERVEPVGSTRDARVADGHGTFMIRPPRAGAYRITVEADGACPATFDIAIAGSGDPDDAGTGAQIGLTLDRQRYAPGDVARVRLDAPFPGRVLVAVETDRVEWSAVHEITGRTLDVAIPVDARWVRGAHVTATLVRPATEHRGQRPARATGSVYLATDARSRTLDVALTAPEQARSGRPFPVAVRVTHGGAPVVGARVALAAIDIGTLALDRSGDPDPAEFFEAARRLGVRESDLFGQLLPELPAGVAANPGGGDGLGGGGDLSPVSAERFRVAAWHGAVAFTDANGEVRTEVVLGRHHGAVRLVAWVAHDAQMGGAGRDVRLTSPVMLELALPRFLAPGDACEGALIVRQLGADAGEIALAIAIDGPLAITGLPATVKLAADGEARIPLAVVALDRAGVARLVARATLGAEEDVLRLEIAVRPASPRVVLERSGRIDAPGRTVLEAPGAFHPGTESATLAVGALPGLRHAAALDALIGYPHGCLEQTVSRAFALLEMGEIAALAAQGGPSAEDVAAWIDAAIARVGTMQTGDGSLGWWPGSGEAYPYGSVYAADFLLAAKARGHAVPDAVLGALLDALDRGLESTPADDAEWGLLAYRARVLRTAGRRVDVALGRLERVAGESLDATARAHFACALAASGEAGEATTVLAGTTPSTGPRSTHGDLRSDVRERAVLAIALLEASPRDPRLPGLVAEIARALDCPAALTTQDAAWALRAMARAAQGEPARWTARLENATTGEVLRRMDPAAALSLAGPRGPYALVCDGTGPIYYSWIARGIPATDVAAIESPLGVRRRYTSLRTGRPVGPEELVAGERYRVTLQVSLRSQLDGVLVSELLPAGLELETADDTSSAHTPAEREARPHVVRVEERDDRILYFIDLPEAREAPWVLEYTVRAVTAGRYVLPPVHAEAMYDPSLRCLGARGVAVVAAR